MGLFGKKEKKLCPVCGNELKLFSSLVVKDGEICKDCENMIRADYNVTEYWQKRFGSIGDERSDYMAKISDPIQNMTVDEIKEMIQTMKEEHEQIMEDVGSDYANVAKAAMCFSIAPKALDVGLKRAKELKNRLVATCQIVAGEFEKGDSVTVTNRGVNTSTKILDVIECSGSSTFSTELNANMGKHKAGAGKSAWIILDLSEGVEDGCLIQK